MNNPSNLCHQLRSRFSKTIFSQELYEAAFTKGVDSVEWQQMREIFKFMFFYKDSVKQLLSQWYDSEQMLDSVEFTADGRVKICGELDLSGTGIDYFPSLIKEVEDLNISETKIKKLDYLEKVRDFNAVGVETLESMKRLKYAHHLDISLTKLLNLPSLRFVEGNLDVNDQSNLVTLSNLKTVVGEASFFNTGIISLPELESVGGLDAENSSLTFLPKLKWVDQNLYLKKTQVKELPSLELVGNYFSAQDANQLASVPRLKKVGSAFNISGTKIVSLPALTEVGGFLASGVTTLRKVPLLRSVFGSLDIKGTNIISMPSLEKVEGSLLAKGVSSLRNLENLEEVGSRCVLSSTGINDLSSLNKVSGRLDLSNVSTLEAVPKLEKVYGFLDINRSSLNSFPVLNYVGVLKMKQTEINEFRETFPVLEETAKGAFNISIYTDDYVIANQISKLKSAGLIKIPGRIIWRREDEFS
jgi:hypothetical protein